MKIPKTKENITGFKVGTVGKVPDCIASASMTLDAFPPYVPEDQNPSIIVKGRWLERGGSAFIVSTAGTGKSIMAMQLAYCWSVGRGFAGLEPNLVGKIKDGMSLWVFQSEDSHTRVTQDREDILLELMETHPDVDWRRAQKRIRFFRHDGSVGVEFIAKLHMMLKAAKDAGMVPDVVVINPLMAYIGGPITDSNYVTPFLRGGVVNNQQTSGLQNLLESYDIGVLIFHHTPKPPRNENEARQWVKTAFPEYQGAGSSDITNWGRSFITMMRVEKRPDMVMLTAGKNGGELGWEVIEGGRRFYLAWSAGIGVTGGNRHAWREPSEDELKDAVGSTISDETKANARVIAEALKRSAATVTDLKADPPVNMTIRKLNKAWDYMVNHRSEFDVHAWEVQCSPKRKRYYGSDDGAQRAAHAFADKRGFAVIRID